VSLNLAYHTVDSQTTT